MLSDLIIPTVSSLLLLTVTGRAFHLLAEDSLSEPRSQGRTGDG